MELTAAVSPSSLPQSSTGRLEASSVLARHQNLAVRLAELFDYGRRFTLGPCEDLILFLHGGLAPFGFLCGYRILSKPGRRRYQTFN